jgi:hypothetical protein
VTETGFTAEELALLGHSELLVELDSEQERDPMPGFRERLALGDLSW